MRPEHFFSNVEKRQTSFKCAESIENYKRSSRIFVCAKVLGRRVHPPLQPGNAPQSSYSAYHAETASGIAALGDL